VRTAAQASLRGARALAEGVSIRATGRLLGADRDTLTHWLPAWGRPCHGGRNSCFRDLHLGAGQVEELWAFLSKQAAHLTPLAKGQEVYGEAWGWIAFSPMYKPVPAGVVGKRTLGHARRLVFRLQSAPDGHIPFFTSEELPHDADARLDVYGVWVTPPRRGRRGRCPKPRRCPPPNLGYAVVVKERENGRGVNVPTRMVYGTAPRVAAALEAPSVSRAITTSGVGRNTLTVRPHSRRIGRKVHACSKAPDSLGHQLTLAFAYYHFVVPHRGLRPRLRCPTPTTGRKGSPKKWQPVTPAMAAGLTAHGWTMDELLSFRVPPKSLW
jgi:IS1 family transposase